MSLRGQIVLKKTTVALSGTTMTLLNVPAPPQGKNGTSCYKVMVKNGCATQTLSVQFYDVDGNDNYLLVSYDVAASVLSSKLVQGICDGGILSKIGLAFKAGADTGNVTVTIIEV